MAIRDQVRHQTMEQRVRAIRRYISGELSEDEIGPIRLALSTQEWQDILTKRQQYIVAQESERIDQIRKTRIAGLVDQVQSSASPNLTNLLLAEILKKLHGMA